MDHQVTGNEDLVDEVNDPVHADDVTHNHLGLLIEIDAILRKKGRNEVFTPTALPCGLSVGPGQVTCHNHMAFQRQQKQHPDKRDRKGTCSRELPLSL